MKLSIVIPARNEQETLEKVVKEIREILQKEDICNEIIIIDDNSTDQTGNIADKLSCSNHNIQVIHRKSLPGFGRAMREGLEKISGDAVVIVMADASDEPRDILRYYYKIKEGYDVVYGCRFCKGAKVYNYPPVKFIANRMGNWLVRFLFDIEEKDITNAFKAYNRKVLEKINPLEAEDFDITIELPIKAEMRKFKKTSVPVNWYGRTSGISKLRLSGMLIVYLRRVYKLYKLYKQEKSKSKMRELLE